jgi:hypothetical protein
MLLLKDFKFHSICYYVLLLINIGTTRVKLCAGMSRFEVAVFHAAPTSKKPETTTAS